MKALICVLTVLIAPTHLLACIPAPPAQLFTQEDAGFVLIGTATTASTWQKQAGEYLVTFTVTEVLRGEAPSTLSAISLCGLPIRTGERVVVGRVRGEQFVYPADDEAAIRTAVRSVR